MKIKYVIVFVWLFLSLPIYVFAHEYVAAEQSITCIYRSGNNVLSVEEQNLGGIPTLGTVSYYPKDNISNPIFAYNGADAVFHYMNWDHTINDLISANGMYATTLVINQIIGEATLNENWDLFCPNNMYILQYKNSSNETVYDLYACGNNYGLGNNTNTCSETRTYLDNKIENGNYDGTDGSLIVLTPSTTDSANAVVGNEDNEMDVQGSYDELMERQEEVCAEEYISENGDEECENVTILLNDVTGEGGQFSDLGADVDELHNNFLNSTSLDFETGGCESYLGDINDNGDDGQASPAYLLNFAFNILKYVAIVLLFVFTVVELAKAVADGKDETRKKMVQRLVKRLVIAVVIFFLPILINFVLTLLGVITDNDACVVGTAPSSNINLNIDWK